VICYVNGNSVGILTAGATRNGDLTNLDSFKIGQNFAYFHGSIDDVRIYNRALSQKEITRLYDNYKPKVVIDSLEKGLVGHWALDSASMKSASTTADLTPYGNDGTLYGRALASRLTTDRKQVANGAMSFDGTNDYVDISSVSDPGTSNWTESAWVKTGAGHGAIVVMRQSEAQESLTLTIGYHDVQDGKARFGYDTTGFAGFAAGTDDMRDDKWHHYVGVRDNENYYLYIDGLLKSTYIDSSTRDVTNGGGWHIGHAGAWNNPYFNGSISDVRIYNRALSAEEVRMLWERY